MVINDQILEYLNLFEIKQTISHKSTKNSIANINYLKTLSSFLYGSFISYFIYPQLPEKHKQRCNIKSPENFGL